MPSADGEERPVGQSNDSATDAVDLEQYRRLRECISFYDLPELEHRPSSRRNTVVEESASTRRYEQTADELLIGAKLAWRNHARCVGRKHWRNLELIDARDAVTADALAEACWEHLRIAPTNPASTPTFHRYYDAPDMAIRPNFVVRAKSGNGCPVL